MNRTTNTNSNKCVFSRTLRLGVSAMALGGCISLGAQAQSADASGDASESEARLATVTVTAERRESDIQDVALAVSAFDEGRIQDIGMVSMEDLALIAPGVDFLPASPNENFLSIRGATTGLVAPGTDQAVSLFLDDVLQVGASGLDQDVFDLQRIEVLRGPQGTLFGRNVTGGAILLYTKDPSFEFDASAKATIGSFERTDFSTYVTGPLSEKIAGIFSFDYRRHDGDYENVVRGGRDMETDNWRVRTSVLFEPRDDLSFQLSAYQTSEEGGQPQIFNTGGNINGDPFTASLVTDEISQAGDVLIAKYDGGHEANTTMLVGRAEWDIPIGMLTSISAYRNRTSLTNRDGTYSSFVAFPATMESADRTFSQELRIASPTDNRLSWVGGVYYLDQNSRYQQSTDVNVPVGSYLATPLVPTAVSTVAAPGCVQVAASFFLCDFQTVWAPDGTGGPNGYRITYDQDVETTSYAVFGELNFDLTEKVSLILGGRYTIDKREGITIKSPGSGTTSNPAVNNLVPFGILPAPLYYPAYTAEYDQEWDAFSPKFGLTYEPNEDILLFATYAEGFRSGGFSLEGRTAEEAATPLEPEFAENYEIGMKSRWLEDRLQINASGYFVTYEDLQAREFRNDINAYVSGNVGDVELYGLEFEGLAQVTERLLIGSNYAFTKSEVTRDGQGAAPDSSATVQDESLPVLGSEAITAPRHQLTLFGTLEFPQSNGGLVKLNADATWASKVYFQRNNADPDFIRDDSSVDGIVNANISYTSPNGVWEFRAFGRNLTDERHLVNGGAEISSLLLTQAEIAAGNGIFGTYYNPPRAFGLSLTWKYH